jgi:hypothetical protein
MTFKKCLRWWHQGPTKIIACQITKTSGNLEHNSKNNNHNAFTVIFLSKYVISNSIKYFLQEKLDWKYMDEMSKLINVNFDSVVKVVK